ncbi:MAG: sulfurtransferase [Chloroflexi bacterium]|nr:sulfurtransferase [Chloroflexota bacterium]
MNYTTLVSTSLLASHLDDPVWIIVDCRFELKEPEWGFAEYQKAHIPGAAYASLDRDLAGPITPTSGRHPLPDPEQFKARLSNWGIDSSKQVVIYDTAGGAFAARLWWMLRYFDHDAVAVLDGGFPKWMREGRPTRAGIESRAPARFEGEAHPEWIAVTEEVDRIRIDPAYRLIDARTAIRYRGEQEPIDPIAGRIPGAANRFHGDNLTPEGTFLTPDELKAQFEALLGGVRPENAVVYCGSGVTSAHHLVAMEHAGLKGARLYLGSWSEWIRDERRARAKG